MDLIRTITNQDRTIFGPIDVTTSLSNSLSFGGEYAIDTPQCSRVCVAYTKLTDLVAPQNSFLWIYLRGVYEEMRKDEWAAAWASGNTAATMTSYVSGGVPQAYYPVITAPNTTMTFNTTVKTAHFQLAQAGTGTYAMLPSLIAIAMVESNTVAFTSGTIEVIRLEFWG